MSKREPDQCLLCGTVLWREPGWGKPLYRNGFCFAKRWPFKKLLSGSSQCHWRGASRSGQSGIGWVYLTTGGIVANYIKVGISYRWPGSRAAEVTGQWPVDLWGSKVSEPRPIEDAIKSRLAGFRPKGQGERPRPYPTETFKIDADLALSIVGDIVGRPLERLAYGTNCPVSFRTTTV